MRINISTAAAFVIASSLVAAPLAIVANGIADELQPHAVASSR